MEKKIAKYLNQLKENKEELISKESVIQELEKFINILIKNEEIDEFFNNICTLYPNKSGKSAIKLATKKKLFKIGYDNIRVAVTNYLKDPNLQRNGGFRDTLMLSTFMNTRYADYLPILSEKNTMTKENILDQKNINYSAKRKDL